MVSMINGIKAPARSTEGSAGYDFVTPVDLTFRYREFVFVDLGVLMDVGDIPDGCVMMIVPRSSMGRKYGLRLSNTVGIIDSDYTMSTIKADLTCDKCGPNDVISIPAGTRILQGTVVPFRTIASLEAGDGNMPNPAEKRKRRGGYGSTGER